MARPTTIRIRRMTVAFAIVGLVYSFGVCPGGCLEENHWYATVHHLVEHDHSLPGCAHEESERCDCEQEPDSAVLVSSWQQDFELVQPAAILSAADTLALSGALEIPSLTWQHASDRVGGATLRAQLQLFRC